MIVYKYYIVYVEVSTGYPGVDVRYAEKKEELLYRKILNWDTRKTYIVIDVRGAR